MSAARDAEVTVEPLRVDVWSDVVCPWCAIGKATLERAVAAFGRPVEVVWHSYELDPTAPAARAGDYVGMIARKYGTTPDQAQAMVDRMVQAGAEAGVEFRFDRVRPGNTFDAHRMIQLGTARGLGPEVKARFLRGYFVDGEAIGLPEVVTRLAVDAGLDPDEVEAVMTTDTFAEEVRTDEAMAASLQVTGVPFFVVDRRYAVAGAQSVDTMLQVLERAAAERASDALGLGGRDTAPDPGGGACDIDGC